jgi:hexosaminidase
LPAASRSLLCKIIDILSIHLPFTEPPAGQLRIASADTQSFAAGLIGAAAKLLPSTYFSTGGDEVNQDCYLNDPETQAALNATGKTLEQALDTFTQATHGALAKEGKTPVVWEGEWCTC